VGADQEQAWASLYEDVRAYAGSLRDCSFFLAEMFNPAADFEAFPGSDRTTVRVRSAALRRSGVVALYRPLLFAARLRHPENGSFYADLVDVCERYSARVFVIDQRRSNTGESALLGTAHRLYRGADPASVLEECRATLWRYAPDERIRTTLLEPLNWYLRRGHKYFLYEYERSLLSPGQQLPELAVFTDDKGPQRTTEHILPQTPADDASCWWDRFTRQEHADLVHTLGNLVLTLDNSAYSNKCFSEKRGAPLGQGGGSRPCYAQGKLHQERLLGGYADWTPETIRTRQRDLADWALQRWAVDPPTPAAALGEVEVEELESEGSQDDAPAVDEGYDEP
jgi:hypothetical protein